MKNITRKQMDEFNNEVVEILEFYGATKVDEQVYFMDSEKLGKLYIRLDNTLSPVYTVFAMFKDVKKASKYFNVSTYSGKINTHEWTPEPCLYHIDSLLDNYNQINGIDKHAEYMAQ